MSALWQKLNHSPNWRFVGASLVLMTLLQLIGPEHFRYQRDWTSTGEIWRIISAHWIHVGWIHLLMNGVGLVVCVSIASPHWSIKRWLIQTLCMAIGISLLITVQNPEIQRYVGFSGVLFGLYFLAAYDLYPRDRLIALLLGAAIVIKVLVEQFTNYNFNSAEIIGAPVVVDAHLYGLLLAIAIALVWSTYTMNHKPSELSN